MTSKDLFLIAINEQTASEFSKPSESLQSPSEPGLVPTEQELHVLGREFLHGDLIVIDGAVDHVGFFLLQHDHPGLDRVLDAKPRDDARTLLADTVTTIC